MFKFRLINDSDITDVSVPRKFKKTKTQKGIKEAFKSKAPGILKSQNEEFSPTFNCLFLRF